MEPTTLTRSYSALLLTVSGLRLVCVTLGSTVRQTPPFTMYRTNDYQRGTQRQ